MTPSGQVRKYVQGVRARRELHKLRQLWEHGEQVLGDRGWFLFKCYGKLMSGPYSGQYVSALPPPDVHALLHALAAHEPVPVHLMHRHRPGAHAGLYTRLGANGHLVMGFADREIDA